MQEVSLGFRLFHTLKKLESKRRDEPTRRFRDVVLEKDKRILRREQEAFAFWAVLVFVSSPRQRKVVKQK